MSEVEQQNIEDIESEENESVKTTPNKIVLELGDIIQIDAASNIDIHEQTFIITYIDFQKIKLVNVSSLLNHILYIDSDGAVSDESITQISLLNRSEERGYARQNGLLPKVWLDIHFGGEIPLIVTGEITNLEEDMIEITTFPGMRIIYIDFKYEGIPENLPIDEFVIRPRPVVMEKVGSFSNIEPTCLESCELPQKEDAEIEYTETGESIITIPASAEPNENIREVLHSMYIDANDIFESDEMEEVTLTVEVPESQKRYTIDAQVNDMMDELLSTVPDTKRSKLVLDNIHFLIERFTQLRQRFSQFDENGNVNDIKINGANYKPLIKHIESFKTKLQWLIPVVQQRKKIYREGKLQLLSEGDDDDRDGILPLYLNSILLEQKNIQESYYKNQGQGDVNKYENSYKQMTPYTRPHREPLDRTRMIVSNVEMRENIDVVIDNLNDFYSNTCRMSEGLLFYSKFRFLLERYNTAITKPHSIEKKSGKQIYIRKPLMTGDKVDVKSFLMLPVPIMKFSHIDLPGTNILEKSQLSQHYLHLSRLLNKKTQVDRQTITNLDKEIDYNDDETNKQTNPLDSIEFLEKITEFNLDEDLLGEDDKFNRFLNTIIPKTRILFRLIKKTINDKLSFVDVVKSLEPFMIYSEDITYQQYNEIRFFIKNQIKLYNTSYAVKLQNFNKISTSRYYNNNPKMNKMESLFSEKIEYLHIFTTAYKIKPDMLTSYTTHELLSHIMNTDNGVMYSNLISRILLSLITPNKLLDGISKPYVADMGEVEKIKPKDCARRFLTKKYHSIKELQKDNNAGEIYYEEEYDDTPYYLLKKYADKKKSMVNELFLEFLAENLIQKHDCPPSNAKELAATLIMGKKKISEGEYAILELRPSLPSNVDESNLTEKEKDEINNESNLRTKTQYYRRVKDHWVHDTSIDEKAFLDTQSLFCNVDPSCFKNKENQQCETNEQFKLHIKATRESSAFSDELDKRISITVEELEKELDKNIEMAIKNIQNVSRLREIQLYKANYLAYELGKQNIMEDIIVCPYAKLFDLILSQDDFVKKQDDILRFVNDYCREPMVAELKEDGRWFYCKETNVKIVPMTVYDLAIAFVSGNYQEKQDELIRFYGRDEGDSIVDKDSGYVIRKLDFSSEEGYDDAGFKITSHGILEKDVATMISEVLSKKIRIFDDEIDQMVYNVFKSISTNIGISIEHIEELVLRVSLELIRDKEIVLEENSYNAKAEKILKAKGKSSVPFPTYRNQTLITIVSAVLLVAIQSSIPTIKSRRTFPGCVRSFNGYPGNGGIENMDGIKYIACVISSMAVKQKPWDAIMKLNAKSLEQRIYDVLDKYLMKRTDIIDLYTKKREYIILVPDEQSIPDEHNINKWTDFLPPVIHYSIVKGLTNVSGEFKQDLLETIRKGHRDQHGYIDTLKYKVKLFGLGMVENINKIVKHKELILQTAAKVPFLENACCNEVNKPTNPLAYFADADTVLLNYLQSSKSSIALLKDIKELSKAPILYHPAFSGIVYPSMPTGHLESNVYAAFIHYCKFDRPMPVPEELRAICGEKPTDYNPSWTLEEKMESLKRHGKRYTVEDLYNLMNIVEKRNRVFIKETPEISEIVMLKDLLIRMDTHESSLIEYPLRKLLNEAIDAYVPKKMMKENLEDMRENSKEVFRLRKYLSSTNDRMVSEITQFITNFGSSIENGLKRNLTEFLLHIHDWQSDSKMKETGLYYDEGLYTITNFIKNSIDHMANIYPNVIMNNVKPKQINRSWGKQWGLSSFHEKDINRYISEYFEGFDKFKNDSTLNSIFIELRLRFIDLKDFVKHIPVETSIIKDGQVYFSLFDKQTTYLLYSYCWYSILHEYIQCAIDPNNTKVDIQEVKRSKREQIRDLENPANFIESVSPSTDQDDIVQMDIRRTDLRELKERVCSLLQLFLSIEMKNKNILDKPYNEISRKVRRAREEEKKTFTTYLENMEKDERKVEDMIKNFKLGRWNVGTQKGVFMYDKDTYDLEREDNLVRFAQDLEVTAGKNGDMGEIGYDIEDLERIDDEAANDFYDEEANGIEHFGVDYMDQGYYDDGVEEDFSDDS
jgi:hypothetical protein